MVVSGTFTKVLLSTQVFHHVLCQRSFVLYDQDFRSANKDTNLEEIWNDALINTTARLYVTADNIVAILSDPYHLSYIHVLPKLG